jgi:hypothetical protein
MQCALLYRDNLQCRFAESVDHHEQLPRQITSSHDFRLSRPEAIPHLSSGATAGKCQQGSGLRVAEIMRQNGCEFSAFTVAHSITLGLSMYGVISVAPRVVEPLIALSIAYVAI